MIPFVLVVALAGAPAITQASLKGHIRFLASDALEGRAPGTAGDRLAEQYIATQLETSGLEPAGADGGWVQPVELVGVTGTPQALTVARGRASLTFAYHDDFVAVAGDQSTTTKVDNAEFVFIGYGITAPEYHWDDFKGVDVKGKIVVVLNNDPEEDPALFAGRARLWYGRWDYKFLEARRHGAAGCLIVHTTASAGYPWQVVQTSWAGEQFELPSTGNGLRVKGWLTEGATLRLFSFAGRDFAGLRELAKSRTFKPVPLGVALSTNWTNTVARKASGNVLGFIRGSDPKLSSEVVVITAHHDHLGRKVGASPGDDAIYNGALDNASGVAALLSIARALMQNPGALKRSVLIAAVAAEEQGLLGSAWLVDHPPVPVSKMVANLNIDGMNIWGRTRDVSVIGLGKSTLDALITELAKAQGRVVKPDALSDRGFFYRSDQFNFARAGVPSAYFSSGQDFIGRPDGWGREQREKWEATNYHQPSDELRDDWDFSGAVEDVQLFFDLAMAVSNQPTSPTWTPGDEFEATRRKSLNLR